MTNAEAIVQIYNKLLEREADIKPDTTVMALDMVAYAAEIIRGELNGIEGTLAQTKKSCVISYSANSSGEIYNVVPPAEYGEVRNSGGTVFLQRSSGDKPIPAQFIFKYDEDGDPIETYIFGMLISSLNETTAVLLKERTGAVILDGYELQMGGDAFLEINGDSGVLQVVVGGHVKEYVTQEVWNRISKERRNMSLALDGTAVGVFPSGGNPACAAYIDSQNRLIQPIFNYDANDDRYYASMYIVTATIAT